MASAHPPAPRPHPSRRGASSAPVKGSPITPARVAAAAVLDALREGALLDAAFERHAGALELRDRRWVQELVWGVLRRRSSLDAVLTPRVTGGLAALDDDVVDLLRLGVAQLLHMDSVPPYAAIAQTVELAKRRHHVGAARLVNAVLRRVERERAQLTLPTPADPVEALAEGYAHPHWLVARWVTRWGVEATERLLAANNTEAPITVRPFGMDAAGLLDALAAAGVAATVSPLVPTSLVLPRGVALTELDAFTGGHLFVQDPAATLVVQYADIPRGAVVADLCAAPGGKTLELARRAALVVAADRSPARVERLCIGLGRLDVAHVHVIVADATAPALPPVDVVLVDVPCTGTGTYRRHPDARWRLKASDFAVLGATQRAILRAAAPCVKPGGLLVYSTCSLEPEENDDPVDAFLAAHPDFSVEAPAPGVVPDDTLDQGRLRVLPQQHGADGAFAVRLRRRTNTS